MFTQIISHVLLPAAVIALLPILPGPPLAAQQKPRIGTFDSRAVAVVYFRSPEAGRVMKSLMERKKEAEEKGDAKGVEKVEREGRLRQAFMHDRGFGKGSVNSILEAKADGIASIARKENLIAVVSTWELMQVGAAVELVDVTDAVVALFTADEKTRAMVKEMRKVEPVKDAYLIDD